MPDRCLHFAAVKGRANTFELGADPRAEASLLAESADREDPELFGQSEAAKPGALTDELPKNWSRVNLSELNRSVVTYDH